MIVGRFGNPVTIERRAVLADVAKFDKRKPDAQDRAALKQGSYWIVRDVETGKHQLYHLAFLRADEGAPEITAACNATEEQGGKA